MSDDLNLQKTSKKHHTLQLLLLLFFATLILFKIFQKNSAPRTFKFRQGIEFTDSIRTELYLHLKKAKQVDQAEIILGYAFGDFSLLSPEKKSVHKEFYLNHLFTPSAFHFTCLLNFLKMPLGFCSKYFFYSKSLCLFLLCLLFLNWSPLAEAYALKRVCYLKMLNESCNLLGYNFSNFILFLSVFFTDYFLGSYSSSPLSFIYSFLFYGTITLLSQKKWYQIWGGLFLGQWLISAIAGEIFFPLHALVGFLLTYLIGIFLPLLLIFFFSQIEILLDLSLRAITYFLLILQKTHQLPLDIKITHPVGSTCFIFLLLIIGALLEIKSNRKEFCEAPQ